MGNQRILINKLKEIIKKEVLVMNNSNDSSALAGNEFNWIFDFRKIFLNPEHLDLITDIFWNLFEEKFPFQVGGQETAAIPLVTAIILKGRERGKPVNGFYIRKSRKKDGLQKIIEGKLTNDKIILIDDLMNKGQTMMRQIKVIEQVDKKIDSLFSIINFRDLKSYTSITTKGITSTSLFTLADFGLTLSEHIREPESNFNREWYFQSNDPNYFYIIPKSTPALDNKKVYFGSDSGNFWALNQNDGSVAWKYKVSWYAKGKSIFSAPAVYNNTVYFGSYDGNVYALDTTTGKKKWIFMEADWVGSSPALAPKLNLLFIGLEFGLLKKRGGIAALDLTTGKKKWEYIMPEYTHSSPAYLASENVVAIGSNDSTAYLFNAKNGRLLWSFKAGREINASFAFDKKRNNVLFGSLDGSIYALNIKSGELACAYKTHAPIYSTPLVHEDNIYCSSLDKRLYGFNAVTGQLKWELTTRGRIFASPTLINNRIYIGSNDGRMYEIDPETGKGTGFFQTTERITNKIVYNKKTEKFFVLTFANEIYCLSRQSQNKRAN